MESIIAGMGLNGNHIKEGTRAGVRCLINDLTLSSITERERERERECVCVRDLVHPTLTTLHTSLFVN
jgi:hypothetical protein